jgi:hypothetical protein
MVRHSQLLGGFVIASNQSQPPEGCETVVNFPRRPTGRMVFVGLTRDSISIDDALFVNGRLRFTRAAAAGIHKKRKIEFSHCLGLRGKVSTAGAASVADRSLVTVIVKAL